METYPYATRVIHSLREYNVTTEGASGVLCDSSIFLLEIDICIERLTPAVEQQLVSRHSGCKAGVLVLRRSVKLTRGSTCLGVPNVPVGTSGCAERVCLHRDGCARMRSAYPECPDPNLSAYPGQDGGCRR